MFGLGKVWPWWFLIIIFLPVLDGCTASHIQRPVVEKESEFLAASSPVGQRAQGLYHTVRPKETLWRIAKAYNVELQTLAELNNIPDVCQIKTGQRIFIPGATKVRPVSLDPEGTCPPEARLIRKSTDFIWPVQGKVVSGFGVHEGLRYDGIEISAPLGTPVKASREGEVVFTGRMKGYGNLLILKHPDTFHTVYAYTEENLVSRGRKVQKGQVIARVGATGPAPEPRLLFQIRQAQQARNPLFYLP